MSNETDSIPGEDLEKLGLGRTDTVYGLLLVWAKREWGCLGQFIPFEPHGRPISFGRDAQSPGGYERALGVYQRPGENIVAPPFASSMLSRDAVVVQPRLYGLEIQSVGKHPMLVGGKAVTSCALEVGQYILVAGCLLFRCVRRPRVLPPLRHLPPRFLGPFGGPHLRDVVGETPELYELLERLAFAAAVPAHVLLHGETGSGKESAAASIHDMGGHASGPFVSFSVANAPRNLIEDELFGRRKNHPQVGMPASEGLVGRAHGGTLFLDEIGELAPDAQGSLLRVLDKGEYKPSGADAPMRSSFKLVAAMNRPEEVLQLDLRKRLITRVDMPTLAQRRDDVPLILRHLLRKACVDTPKLTASLMTTQADGSREAVPPLEDMERLLARETYDGNVRDLIAAVWQMLYERMSSEQRAKMDAPPVAHDDESDEVRGEKLTREEITWCLRQTGGNVAAAARLARVSRQAFYRALKRAGGRGAK